MGKIYWKSWIKRNWWKILLPVIVPIGLCILWYIKKHQEFNRSLEWIKEK